MDDRVIQFRVGVLVIATVIITVILVMLSGELPNFSDRHYVVHAKFSDAPGVTVDTPVRKHGILIGRASRVALVDDGALVTMKINAKYPLKRNEYCRIGSGNLFGDAVLQFIRIQDAPDTDQVIQPGEFIEGKSSQDPLSMFVEMQDDIVGALDSVRVAGDQVSALAKSLNAIMDENGDQLGSILNKADGALSSIDEAMTSFNDLLGDDQIQADIQNAVRQMPEVLAQAKMTLSGLSEVAESAKLNLRNLEGFTEPLGEQGPELVAQMEATFATLDSVFSELNTFTEGLNSEDGTLGQLIHNPHLYQRLDRAVANVETVTARLQPIMRDVRIFTDKIARDPRQLGVRGAMDRQRSGFKGSPNWELDSRDPEPWKKDE